MTPSRARLFSMFVLGVSFTVFVLSLVFVSGRYYLATAHPSNQARFNTSLDKLDAATHRFDALSHMIEGCIQNTKTPATFERCLADGYKRIDSGTAA